MCLYLGKNNFTAFCEEEDHSALRWEIDYKDGYYFFIHPGTEKVMEVQEGSDKLRCKATNKVKGPKQRMIVSPVELSGSNYVKIPPRHWKVVRIQSADKPQQFKKVSREEVEEKG